MLNLYGYLYEYLRGSNIQVLQVKMGVWGEGGCPPPPPLDSPQTCMVKNGSVGWGDAASPGSSADLYVIPKTEQQEGIQGKI